jgi:high-affinity iron transporter
VLPTFVIALREGLEAVLIVTIIATFLRQSGARLRGLWVGVGAGVALSIAVGVVLRVVEQSLPQAKQEAMETVIGAIAVFFVTGMVFWMRTHSRSLKRELESHAADALRTGTTTALAVMAFLAVLREGFETAVFLLATFQNASSAPAAMAGAVLGLVAAIGLGWAMYAGGMRINLQRFFKVTGIFLVLVAAGLVLSAFRTAHEAGWVTIGQGRTVDLSWLTPQGSIRSALVTGVLGMPADPRVVELLAWAAYLVPMLALTLWPAALRPSHVLAQRLRVAGAAAAVVAAVVLVLAVGRPQPHVPATAPVATGGTVTFAQDGGSASIERANTTTVLDHSARSTKDGADTSWTTTHVAGDLPATVDLQQLLDFNGGRIPSGLSVATAPGPFHATWTDKTELTVLSRDGGLVDAQQGGTLLLTYSGGGLTTPRVLTVDGWQVDPSYVASTSAAIADADADAREADLWKLWVPTVLVVVALGLLVQARRSRTGRGSAPAPGGTPAPHRSPAQEPKGITDHVSTQAQ